MIRSSMQTLRARLQMGAALADGGRRLDQQAWEQHYEAAAIVGWSPFNREVFLLKRVSLL